MLLDIIIGRSIVSDVPVIGVALHKHRDTHMASEWSRRNSVGMRPIATHLIVGTRTADDREHYARNLWTKWAEDEGVELTFTEGRREVARPF